MRIIDKEMLIGSSIKMNLLFRDLKLELGDYGVDIGKSEFDLFIRFVEDASESIEDALEHVIDETGEYPGISWRGQK